MARRLSGALPAIVWLAAVSAAANMLENPSFEVPADHQGSASLPGWKRWSEAGWAGQYAWDRQAGRRFGKSGSMCAAWARDVGGRGGWISEIPAEVNPDRFYVLAGYVSVHRAAGEARLGLRFLRDGRILGESLTPAVSGSSGTGAGDWVAVAVRARPPEGATHAQAVCRADHLLGDAWFEDVALIEERAGTAPSAEAIRRDARKALDQDAGAQLEEACAKRLAETMRNIDAMREKGEFWQPAGIAAARARVLLGIGGQNRQAGWERRAAENLAAAVREINMAMRLAERLSGRPDPLPATGRDGIPVGVSLPWRYGQSADSLEALFADLRRCGFSSVEMDFPWGAWEPREGERDFSFFEEILDRAALHAIRIYAACGPKFSSVRGRVPGAAASLLGPPAWYMEKFPESALLSAAGERIKGCDGLFWDFAFADPKRLSRKPEFLASWEESLRALSGRLGGKQALAGWFLSHRPVLGQAPSKIRNLENPGLLGHNPHYREAFRNWLKEKYGEAKALRNAWGREAPRDFSRAEPPGPDQILASKIEPKERYPGSRARITDWLEFRAVCLAEGVEWQAGLLQDAAPGRPAVPRWSAFGPEGPLDPEGLSAELAGQAKDSPLALDLAADAVPAPLHTHAQDVALAAARAAGRPLWLSGYALRSPGLLSREDREDLLPPHLVGPYVWSGVAGGVRGFFFRGWQEKPGPDSLSLAPLTAGKRPGLSEEGEALALAAAELGSLASWLAAAKPASPRCAVLVCANSLLFEDPQAGHPLAWMHLLSLAGINEADIISPRQLKGLARQYAVIFAPHLPDLDAQGCTELAGFVRGGGVLISDTYLASREEPLGHGLGGLFGIKPLRSGTSYSEEGTIGAVPTKAFTELAQPVPISLSYFPGSFQVRALPGTEVLADYTGSRPDGPVPAITVRAAGKGKAVIFPRIRLAREHVESLEKKHIFRPQMWGIKAARGNPELSGFFIAVALKALLERLAVLPDVRLLSAPVDPEFLESQGELLSRAGVGEEEIEHSAKLVMATQCGMPFLSPREIISLKRDFGVDMDSFTPVRVALLEGSAGGRLAIVINHSALARRALIGAPGARAALDLLCGEEHSCAGGKLELPMAPYQCRLLALLSG